MPSRAEKREIQNKAIYMLFQALSSDDKPIEEYQADPVTELRNRGGTARNNGFMAKIVPQPSGERALRLSFSQVNRKKLSVTAFIRENSIGEFHRDFGDIENLDLAEVT